MKSLKLMAAFVLMVGTLFSPAMADDKDPAAGTAKGTCAKNGEAAIKLEFASAFVDQKDEKKPTLLIVSDIKLPTEKWESEFDLMRDLDKNAFSGAIFFLDKDGNVFRTDFYWHGHQSSLSGYFQLKLDKHDGKDFTGSISTNAENEANDPKVDATFHAQIKL